MISFPASQSRACSPSPLASPCLGLQTLEKDEGHFLLLPCTYGSRSFWLETSSRSSTSKAENDQGVKVASLRAFKVILSSRYPGARDHSEFLRLTTSSQRGPNGIPSFSLVPIKTGLNALWRELGHVNLMRMCNLSLLECSTVIPCGE